MTVKVDGDTLKQIFYMLARSTALSDKVDTARMVKLVRIATMMLADLLDEVQEVFMPGVGQPKAPPKTLAELGKMEDEIGLKSVW